MTRKLFPHPATAIALVALFVALGGVGMAATGDNFLLGKSNSATSSTSLVAPIAGGKALQLTNTDTTRDGSTALGLSVGSGHPPFTVNSKKRVTNLNADLLDGLDVKDVYWATGADTAGIGVPNAKGVWTTVAKTSFKTSSLSSWAMLGQTNISFTSDKATTSLVHLRYLVNGKVDDDPVFPNTVGAGAIEALPAAIKCNAMPPGAYTIELQVEASADDGTFASEVATLEVVGSGISSS